MFKYIGIGTVILGLLTGNISSYARENIKSIEQFEFTEIEKAEFNDFLQKVGNKKGDHGLLIIEEAMKGNPIAMYVVGKQLERGINLPINREGALAYYRDAASLGYAPALIELAIDYADKGDLLALVYLNLTISYNHPEIREVYYESINRLSKELNEPLVAKEIEQIAMNKSGKIYGFKQKVLERTKGNTVPAICIGGDGITHGDFTYNETYWKKFFSSEKAWREFFYSAIEKPRIKAS